MEQHYKCICEIIYNGINGSDLGGYMQGLVEEYGAVLITLIIASTLLSIGFWLFNALQPMFIKYIAMII